MTREPKDPRSTGRKRARKTLERTKRPFHCSCEENHDWHSGDMCRWEPDPNKPIGRDNNLDVNHKNKNILDNDPVNLEYLCRRCHREIDRRTEKGVSIVEDEFGYEGLL